MKYFLSILACVIVSGCASNIPTSYNSSDGTAICFVDRMSLDLSKKLSYPDVMLSKKFLNNINYLSFYVEFIPFNVGYSGVIESIANYCSGIGGLFNNGSCFLNNELKFYSKIKNTGYITNDGKEVGVFILERKKGADYKAFLKKAQIEGYLSENDIKNKNKELIKLVLDNMRIEKNKTIAVINSPIGSQVCKIQDGYKMIAYIEQHSGEKLKLLVADAFAQGAPNMKVSGFSQYYTWDSANNWYLCK